MNTMKSAILILALCLPALAQTPAERLQKGLFEEEVNHNLEAAIREYRAILEASAEQRRIAATALYRLAESHRKLGRTNESAELFARLVREYPEQESLLARSAQRPTPAPAALEGSTWKLNALQIAQSAFTAASLEVALNALTNLPDTELRFVLPVVSPTPELEHLTQQSIAQAAKLHAISVDYGDQHHEVARLRSLIQTLQQQIDKAAEREISSMQFTLASSRAFLQSVKAARVQQLPIGDIRETALQAELNELLAAQQRMGREAAGLQMKLQTLKDASPTNLPTLVPSVYPTPALEFLHGKIAELQRDLAARLTDFGDEHTEILKERRKLSAYHEARGHQLKGILKGLETRVAMAEAGAAALRDLAQKRTAELKQLSGTPSEPAEPSRTEDLARELENSPDLLEAVFGTGMTRLQTAAKDSDLEMIEFLLSRGASVDKYSDRFSTPLFLAVQAGHLRAAELLIQAGADVNAAPHHRTPLHEVARRGYKNLMELLVARGANVNQGASGYTPLHAAVAGRQAEAITFLAAHGAKVEGTGGTPPLYLAISERDYHDHSVIEALLKAGADPNREGTFGPLFIAVPYPPIAAILLARGANPNVRNHQTGETPLFYSVQSNIRHPALQGSRGPFLETTRLLLEKGADPNAKDENGLTPMHHALSSPEALKLLLQAGGDPNTTDANGASLLEHARSIPESLELLFKHGAKTRPLTDAAPPNDSAANGTDSPSGKPDHPPKSAH